MCGRVPLSCARAADLYIRYIEQLLELSYAVGSLPVLRLCSIYAVSHCINKGYRWLWGILKGTATIQHTNTATNRHRHTNMHIFKTRRSLAPFLFAKFCPSALRHISRVTPGACHLHPAPSLIIQQHRLRSTFIFFLTRAVSGRSPTFPPFCSVCLPFPGANTSTYSIWYPKCVYNHNERVYSQKWSSFLCRKDQTRLKVRVKHGFANTNCSD